MRAFFTLIAVALGVSVDLLGQTFNHDSLYKIVIEKVPVDLRASVKAQYDSASSTEREFMLYMLYLPCSSKAEQLQNLDANLSAILKLKNYYSKNVPSEFAVSIEFNPEDRLARTKESIDIRVMDESDKTYPTVVFQEWNVEYPSPKLDTLLSAIKWNTQKLLELKKLLQGVNCISIENGNPTTIGFARSGMGKYSYKIFDTNLTPEQKEEYNNGCTYLFYKDNLVLEYGGGAIGPQCFPDH